MFPIYHIKEKEDIIKRKRKHYKSNIYILRNKRWVVEKGQTHDGIIDSGNCLYDMKRGLRTILD